MRDSEEKQNTEVIKNRINDGGVFFTWESGLYTCLVPPTKKEKRKEKKYII